MDSEKVLMWADLSQRALHWELSLVEKMDWMRVVMTVDLMAC